MESINFSQKLPKPVWQTPSCAKHPLSSRKLQDATGSWPLALFAPAIGFFVTGAAVFTVFGSSDAQDFEGRNEPFGLEASIKGLLRAGAGPTKND